jgi:saccharopine dehydrogenase (NADP+, L-glutamate forming)
MARTVTLPASTAVRLRLEGRLPLSGVHIPVVPEIYEPVLEEMERFGVRFEESETAV